ncbi:MAG: SIS domain-containing protein, partial [Dehalococcoidia bacterium]|nr:SIS domain-containing protein [Dehalococcoidia bacterium]
ELADVVVETSEPDPSSAFTISHTAALTALTMLTLELSNEDSSVALLTLPDAVRGAISTEDSVKNWAARSKDVERFYFLGTGLHSSTSYEAALKMKEANYTTTEGFHLEQYLHGPFVSTDEGCMVTFVAPPNSGPEDRVADLMRTVTEVGARTAALLQSGDDPRYNLVDTVITVPECPEIFAPIVYLVPLQLFTYWLALELGHNPDVFRLNDPRHVAARRHYTL